MADFFYDSEWIQKLETVEKLLKPAVRGTMTDGLLACFPLDLGHQWGQKLCGRISILSINKLKHCRSWKRKGGRKTKLDDNNT